MMNNIHLNREGSSNFIKNIWSVYRDTSFVEVMKTFDEKAILDTAGSYGDQLFKIDEILTVRGNSIF